MQNKIMVLIIRTMEVLTLFLLLKSVMEFFNGEYKIIDDFNNIFTENNFLNILFLITLYCLIHAIRIFRIYILLVEDKKKVKDFIKIYFTSTFVNNVLPFKIGEIYMILSFSRALKNIKNGIVLILLNRFFDALILLALSIVPAFMYGEYSQYNIYVFLFVFIFVAISIYISFEGTYKYFNRLILTKSKRPRGVAYLNILDKFNEIYNDIKHMIRGRGTILFSLSAIIWILEYNFVKVILKIFNVPFDYKKFIQYIDNAFFGIYNNISTTNFTNIILLLISIILIYILSQFRRSRNK